ncbi:MAG: hypothetical protein VYC29_10480 [Pseudomonadota bacterium]|nr:hypothetical protein [Pseudomonadota bacterium]
MKVKFTADYNHRWPSRAMTFFPAGYEGTVKREVGEAAIAKGRATEVRASGKHGVDAKAPAISDSRRGGRMARPDDADHVGAVILNTQVDGARQ